MAGEVKEGSQAVLATEEHRGARISRLRSCVPLPKFGASSQIECHMIVLAYIIFWLGLIAWLTGGTMFLAAVFRCSLVWFFGCLFVPFADVIYFLLHPRQTWKAMLIATVGMLVAGAGYSLGGFTFLDHVL